LEKGKISNIKREKTVDHLGSWIDRGEENPLWEERLSWGNPLFVYHHEEKKRKGDGHRKNPQLREGKDAGKKKVVREGQKRNEPLFVRGEKRGKSAKKKQRPLVKKRGAAHEL